MGFTFLKSALFPRSTHATYTLLPSFGKDGGPKDEYLGDTTQAADCVGDDNIHTGAATTTISSSKVRVDARLISDATIGLSDGLTVPFALTAGLSALGDTKVVIYGGLAELIAGGISMGLGGYLGARGEAQAYESAQMGTRRLIADDRVRAKELVVETLSSYHLSSATMDVLVSELATSPADLERFLMRFHHQLSDSTCTSSRVYASALTIASGYFFGGLIPLTPYFIAPTNQIGFVWSVIVMTFALFAFGYVKTMLVGDGSKVACAKAGAQMVVLGGVAAAAAMGCVKTIAGE